MSLMYKLNRHCLLMSHATIGLTVLAVFMWQLPSTPKFFLPHTIDAEESTVPDRVRDGCSDDPIVAHPCYTVFIGRMSYQQYVVVAPVRDPF